MVNGYLTHGGSSGRRAIGSAAARAATSPAASRAVSAAMAAASRVGPIAGGAAIAAAAMLAYDYYRREQERRKPFDPLPPGAAPHTFVGPGSGNWVLDRDCGDLLPVKWIAKGSGPSCNILGEHDYWIFGRMGNVPPDRWDAGVLFYAHQWDPVPYYISPSGYWYNYTTHWRTWRNYGAREVPPPDALTADGLPGHTKRTLAPPAAPPRVGLYAPHYNPGWTSDPADIAPPRPWHRLPGYKQGTKDLTNPDTEGINDRDLVDDTYTHVDPPVLHWASNGPDVVISRAAVHRHARRSPGRGEKERKVKSGRGAYRVLRWALELTEFKDAVDSIYEAIPGAPRVSWATFRVAYIYEHWDEVDLNQAVYNLVYNQLEDAIVGGAMRRVADSRNRLGQRPGDVWGI